MNAQLSVISIPLDCNCYPLKHWRNSLSSHLFHFLSSFLRTQETRQALQKIHKKKNSLNRCFPKVKKRLIYFHLPVPYYLTYLLHYLHFPSTHHILRFLSDLRKLVALSPASFPVYLPHSYLPYPVTSFALTSYFYYNYVTSTPSLHFPLTSSTKSSLHSLALTSYFPYTWRHPFSYTTSLLY